LQAVKPPAGQKTCYDAPLRSAVINDQYRFDRAQNQWWFAGLKPRIWL